MEYVCLACGDYRWGTMLTSVRRVDGPSVMAPGMFSLTSEWGVVSFPLCEKCLKKIGPAERLPYYRERWLETDPGPQDLVEWLKIEELVLAGEIVGVPQGRGIVVGSDE